MPKTNLIILILGILAVSWVVYDSKRSATNKERMNCKDQLYSVNDVNSRRRYLDLKDKPITEYKTECEKVDGVFYYAGDKISDEHFNQKDYIQYKYLYEPNPKTGLKNTIACTGPYCPRLDGRTGIFRSPWCVCPIE